MKPTTIARWALLKAVICNLFASCGSYSFIPQGTSNLGKGFDSFNALKRYLGSPGENRAWHHIVEQSQIGKSGFATNLINNTKNIISIDSATHAKISGYYSSKPDFAMGKTVRDWLAGKSFEFQFQFGMDVLKRYGVIK